MEGVSKWIVGGFVCLLGLGALILAGQSQDPVVHYSALGVFLICIVFVMMLIKLAFEREHRDR